MAEEYNGWKNRSTWNVMLWINNEEWLYRAAVQFMQGYTGRRPYKAFIAHTGLEHESTTDGIKWLSNRLDYQELNAAMRELVD